MYVIKYFLFLNHSSCRDNFPLSLNKYCVFPTNNDTKSRKLTLIYYYHLLQFPQTAPKMCFIAMDLKLQGMSELVESFSKHSLLDPKPEGFDSVDLPWGPQLYIAR